MAKPIKNKVKNGIVFTGKTWSYVLRTPDPATGKTKPLWVGGFDSEKSAKLARDKARVALGNRDYVPPAKITVGEYMTTFLESHKNRIKPTSFTRYKNINKNYITPGLGAIKLQDLRPFHIAELYDSLLGKPGKSGKPITGRTVVYIGRLLRLALKHAKTIDNIISVNPASRVRLPKHISNTPTPYSMSELRQLLEVAKSHRLYFFFRLSAYTGARRGELLALRWSDFDGKAITISKNRTSGEREILEMHSTKGGKNGQRRVLLDPETIDEFTAHRKRQLKERLKLGELWTDTGYVFVQSNGLPLYPNSVSGIYQKLIKIAGLRKNRLHDNRHTHATELLRLGVPLHVVADRLGHRDAMVTATIYAHVSTEQADNASDIFARAMSAVN
jgi:integrase